MTETHSNSIPPKYLKIQEVADLFRISRSTAYRLKKSQQWPHLLVGSETRFSPAHIAAIEAMMEQAPPAPKVVPSVGTRANRRRQRDG